MATRSTAQINQDLLDAQNLFNQWDADFRSLEVKLKKMSKADLEKKASKSDHPYGAFQNGVPVEYTRQDLIQFILKWTYGEAIAGLDGQIADLKNELVEAHQVSAIEEYNPELEVTDDEEYDEMIEDDFEDMPDPDEEVEPEEVEAMTEMTSQPAHLSPTVKSFDLDPKKRLTRRNQHLIETAANEEFTPGWELRQGKGAVEIVHEGTVYTVFSDYKRYYFIDLVREAEDE